MASSVTLLDEALPIEHSPKTIETSQDERFTLLPLPAHPSLIQNIDPLFGRIITNANLSQPLSPTTISKLTRLLHTHSVLVFKNQSISPQTQLQLTRMFDTSAPGFYGHDNNTKQKSSILHPDLKTIPSVPQVQLIGHGHIAEDHEGLVNVTLNHPHHKTFHKTVVSQEDEDKKGWTRFYRWHIDAALYDLCPPVATTLYAIRVPKAEWQTVKYDDGSGEELKVPVGATAFISGAQAFDILPRHYKSLAVRTRVTYAPHPYVWMSPAKSNSVGLGIITEGKELAFVDLPPFSEDKIKTLPMVWKNPTTERLHLQVHPSAILKLEISAVEVPQDGDLFASGAVLTDLKEVRDLVYGIQRPAVSPQYVYAHDWSEGDFVIFHNRGVLHSVTGAFKEDQVRMFHQCNLASGYDPVGPDAENIAKYC
ncbi:UNVERIFIED_CONTAM: hypothetical protein HDU68_010010 [Siphonaria sp. JEL0065]|nr:hypothetical protein HDU68_010010 [Siphonaria sp. JEL0065]